MNTTNIQLLNFKVALWIMLLTFSASQTFAQTETEPNDAIGQSGVQRIYVNTNIVGMVNGDPNPVDYWEIAKPTGASGTIAMTIENQFVGGSVEVPATLEQRSGSYNGTILSSTVIHSGNELPLVINNFTLDYTDNYFYTLRVAYADTRFTGNYNYRIEGFSPSSCTQPSEVTSANFSAQSNQITLNSFAGSIASNYAVSVNTSNAFTGFTDGFVDPTVSGTTYGGGEQIVYAGTSTSPATTITNLTANTTYYFDIAGSNDCSSFNNFNGGFKTNYTTCGAAPNPVTTSDIRAESPTQIIINSFTGGSVNHPDGALGYVVKINSTNSFSSPVSGATLPGASTTYTSGEQVVFAGSSASPATIVDGLTALSTYYFQVYTYDLCGGVYYYETTGFNTNVQTCGDPNNGSNVYLGLSTNGTNSQLIQYDWGGNATNLLIYANTVNSFTTPDASYPTLPTANTEFASTGQQLVYNFGAPGFHFTMTGLQPNTTYYYQSYTYRNCEGTAYVNQTDTQTITTTTCNFSDNLASNPVFGAISSTQMELNAFTPLTPTAPSVAPDGYIIRMSTTNSFSSFSNGAALPSANTAYGSGEQVIYTGTSSTPNLTLTGLSTNTTYYFNIVAYFNCSGGTTPLYQQAGYTFSKSNDPSLTDPTITFEDITVNANGANFDLSATSNSPGLITYSIINQTSSGTSLNGIQNRTVTIGPNINTVTLQASQVATGSFASGIATATLTIVGEIPTISGIAAYLVNSGTTTIDLSSVITSNSSGAMTYTIEGDDLGYVLNGNILTVNNVAGSIVIKTTQAAAGNFDAVEDFQSTAFYNPGLNPKIGLAHTIFDFSIDGGQTFIIPPTRNFLDADVSYSIVGNANGSTLNGKNFVGGNPGTVTLRASTTGNIVYNTTDKDIIVTINGTPQSITFNPLADVVVTDADFNLSATSSSGLGVTYTSSNPSVATISGNTVTLVGVGSTSITASQTGDATYSPAPDVVRALTVNPPAIAEQTISASVGGACTADVTVSLASSQEFVNYTLRDASDNSVIEGPVAGTGSPIDFSAHTITATTTFEVLAETTTSSLVLADQPAVQIAITDQSVNITQPTGSSTEVSLTSSQTGLNYYLRNNADDVIRKGPLAGTGSGITFPVDDITENTTYNVYAAESSARAINFMDFDGVDDYIVTPTAINSEFSGNQITLETWAYIPASETGATNLTALIGQEFVDSKITFALYIWQGTMYAGFFNSGWTDVQNITYPTDLWIHVAATYDQANIKLYINGAEVGSTAATAALPSGTTGEWRIGRRWDGGVAADQIFSGSLAETRIWNEARTQAEIQSDMNTTITTAQTGLVVNYNYTDGSGTTVTDASGNFYNGTMTNMTGDATNWKSEFLGGSCALEMTTTPTATFNPKVTIANTDIDFTAPSLVYDESAKTYTAAGIGSLTPALPGSELDLTYEGRSGTAYASSATAPTHTGDYTVTATVKVTNMDYTGSATLDFSIVPIDLTVTANAGQTKVYGAADPVSYSYSLTGGSLLGTDALSGEATRAVGENVGQYAITQGTITAGVNYNINFVSSDFDITTAVITISPLDATITYGVTGIDNTMYPYVATGFQFMDDETVLNVISANATVNIVNAASPGNALSAGTHIGALEWNGRPLILDNSGNYAVQMNGVGDVTVSAAQISVNAEAKSKDYDGDAGTDPVLTYTVDRSSLPTTNAITYPDPLPFTGALTRLAGQNADTYSIVQGDLSLGSNYAITYTPADFTINKVTLEATADFKSMAYAAASMPVLTISYTGFVNSEDETVIDSAPMASTSATLTSNAGDYVITLTGGTDNNYTINLNNGTFRIEQRALTVSVQNETRLYGAANPTFTLVPTGFVNGETVADLNNYGNLFADASAVTTTSNVGTYTISVQASGTTLETNYNIVLSQGTLTVNPSPLTITPDAGQNKTYGQADPTLTYTTSPMTLVGSDAFTGSLSRVDAATDDIGTYAITLGDLHAGSNNGNNYDVTLDAENFEVTAKALTITVDADQTKVYGETDPTLTYTITTGTLESGDSFAGELDRVAGEDAGSYAIGQGSLTAGSNYSITFVSDDFVITTKELTVAVDADQTKIYGQTDPILTYTLTAGTLESGDSFAGALDRVSGEDAGNYAIGQGSLTPGSNYSISFVSDDFVITTKELTVIVDADQTKVYGQTDPTLAYTLTAGTLESGDSFTGAPDRVTGEDAGNYSIGQGSLTAGSNYSITFVSDDFVITTKELTVTADADQTKVYGQIEPTLTYTLTAGTLESGDSFTGALTRIAGENVNTYAIQQGTLTAGANYTVTFNGDDFSITPTGVTVIVDSDQTKVYGQPDPANFTYTAIPALEAGDSFSGALTRAVGEGVNIYAIQQGTLSAGNNYVINYIGSNFRIEERQIEITADDKIKTVGQSDPTLTYTITNGSLASGDAVTGGLTRVSGESVGNYAINQGTISLGSNYDLTFVPGTFTVTNKLTQTITFSALADRTYGDANFTISAIGGESGNPVTFTSSNTAIATVAGNTLTILSAGTTNITASQLGDATYGAAADVIRPLTINARAIEITADAKIKDYGDSDPALTYQLTSGSLVGGDTFSGNLSRDTGENAGTYNINQGDLALNSNYALTYVAANFTIDKISQTITFTDDLTDIDLADGAIVLTATGGVSGEAVTYTSSNTAVATVSGNTISLVSVGTTTITASQAGNTNYETATPVDQLLTVTSLFIWDGAAWNTGSAPTSTDDAQIDGDYSFAVNGIFEVNNLDVSVGNTLTVDEDSGNGSTLIVNGDLNSAGLVHITSGTSLVTLGNVFGTGYQIDRTTTFDQNTGRYSIIGSPVTNADFSILGSSALIYGYDQSEAYNPSGNEGLDRFKTPSTLGITEMEVGQGYFSAFTGDASGLVSFTGTPNTGMINVSLGYTDHPSEEDDQEGFNLVSNPYPSAIEFTKLMSENSGADISGSIYLWDDNNSETSRGDNSDYLIVNALGNTDSRSGGEAKWDGFIRSGQGFFVQANSTTNIQFNNDMRVVNNNTDGGYFRKLEEVTSFKLLISGEQTSRAAVIGFAEDASTDLDRNYDAHSLSNGALQLYSLQANQNRKLAIQGLPTGYQAPIRLGFKAEPGETYTLSLADFDSVNPMEVLMLTDHKTGNVIDLSQESFTFIAGEETNEERFTILTSPVITTSIEEQLLSQVRGYISQGKLHVRFLAEQFQNANIRLMDLTGKTMVNEQIRVTDNLWSKDISRLPETVYVLLIETELGIVRNKLIKGN